MTVITVTSEKGGTGKTTIATHVAAGMAARGKRVLLIDGDPQGQATLSLGSAPWPGFHDLLVRGTPLTDLVYTPPESVTGPLSGSLLVLPGNEETYTIPSHVEDANVLASLLSSYSELSTQNSELDLVVIDTAPTPALIMGIILLATDFILVPTQTEFLSLTAVETTIRRALTFPRKAIRLMGIIPNMMRPTALHRQNRAHLQVKAAAEGWSLLPALPMRTAWGEASQVGKLVNVLYPDSDAALELKRIIDRVEEAL